MKTADIKNILVVVAGVMIAGGLMYALRDIEFIDSFRKGFDR